MIDSNFSLSVKGRRAKFGIKKILLILPVLIFTASPLFAERILFKSGKELEAKIVMKTASYIKVNFQDMSLMYPLGEVESIDGKDVMLALGKEGFLFNLSSANRHLGRIRSNSIIDTTLRAVSPRGRTYICAFKTFHASDVDLSRKLMYTANSTWRYAEVSSGMLESGMRPAVSKMFERSTKTIQEELFLDGDELFVKYFSGSWLKVNFPWYSEEIPWQKYPRPEDAKSAKADVAKRIGLDILTTKEGATNKEGLARNLSFLYQSINMISADKYNNGISWDVFGVSEGDFMGKPCYIVDTVITNLGDLVAEELFARGRISSRGSKVAVSLLLKEFISKDNFLRLGSQSDLTMSFFDAMLSSDIEENVKVRSLFDYPSGVFKVPGELKRAVAAGSEEKLAELALGSKKISILPSMVETSDSSLEESASAGISVNEDYFQAILEMIHMACAKFYTVKHTYPRELSDLSEASPPYISEGVLSRIADYAYKLNYNPLGKDNYTLEALPLLPDGEGGNVSYKDKSSIYEPEEEFERPFKKNR